MSKTVAVQHNPSPNNWARVDVWEDEDYIGCYSGIVDYYEVYPWAQAWGASNPDGVAKAVMDILDPTGKAQEERDKRF